MSKQRLEKVLELMINEENDKASDLLHDIFVEKARKIYADMIKEDQDIERDLNEADWDDEYDFDTSDAEDDLEKDSEKFSVEGLDDEIDTEEMYEGDDDMADEDDESEFDLADEMGPEDEDMEHSEEDMASDMESDSTSADEAFMNVEDALAELKAAFADIVGDAGSEEDGEESEDEFDAGEYDYEGSEDEGDEEIKESADLTKVAAPKMKGGDDGKASPFAKVKDSDKLGKPMKNAIKNSEETGGKVVKAKPIGVPGPQDVDAKLKPASVRKMKG